LLPAGFVYVTPGGHGRDVVFDHWGTRPRKNSEIHIDVSHSRQPLVKGERLVRYEVNTVMGNLGCKGVPDFEVNDWGPWSSSFRQQHSTLLLVTNVTCMMFAIPVREPWVSFVGFQSYVLSCIIDPKVFGCAAPGNVPDQGNT
jgi:hypothetical protein